MNSHDKNNLNFLLTASQEELKVWYEKTTDVDHAYAKALMSKYYEEVQATAAELLEEWSLEEMTEQGHFPEADAILEKYLN